MIALKPCVQTGFKGGIALASRPDPLPPQGADQIDLFRRGEARPAAEAGRRRRGRLTIEPFGLHEGHAQVEAASVQVARGDNPAVALEHPVVPLVLHRVALARHLDQPDLGRRDAATRGDEGGHVEAALFPARQEVDQAIATQIP